MTEQKEISLGSYETNSWYHIPKQEKTFLKDGRQSQVDFFQSWAVVLPKFHANCLFKNEGSWKYNPGSVKANKNLKGSTSGCRE